MSNDYEKFPDDQQRLPPDEKGALPVTELETAPEKHDNDRLEAIEYTLAEFRYRNGLRVIFTYDELSRDYGLLQEGRIDESAPLLNAGFDTLLDAYLYLAPNDLPIPEELLDEGVMRNNFMVEVKARGVSPTPVVASQLEFPISSSVAPAAGQSCFSTYYSWWDWHDPASPGLGPKAYYASTFGGKKRYAQSYIANCVPAGSGSWLWARHRIYYKSAGNYKKHFEGKVPPGHWQAKTKGSIKRYRRVIYDDGWNSSPSNSNLKYTREGRFRN